MWLYWIGRGAIALLTLFAIALVAAVIAGFVLAAAGAVVVGLAIETIRRRISARSDA